MSSAAVVIGAVRVNLNIGTCFSGGKSANSVANIWNNAGAVNENGGHFQGKQLCNFHFYLPYYLGSTLTKECTPLGANFFL